MRCEACRFDNPAGMRFCGQCGASLAPRCPSCGVEVPAGFRFCGQCGANLQPGPVPAGTPAPAGARPVAAPAAHAYTPKHLAEKILKSRSALEGERRQVTVLFADLAGFTALAETLDPEDVHRIINRCFELITAEVHRFEGTINQYTGDGVMALFEAPIAHEDSPRRAVHAALGIQRALRDYSHTLQAERGLSVAMRIGLNTGPVVVGRIGDDLRMDYTAVGDTTNLAARMQQMARPGSVLVSEATQQAIAGFFETLDLGQLEVKGHRPVQAWEVLRPRARSRLDVAAERGLTPLVGRASEITTLLERFADVKTGRGQVVLVTGEAGIGKSRLLLEFRRRLAEAGEDCTWLEGQCVSFGQSIPFLPLIDQARRTFRIEELDGEPEIIAKIEHGMRRMGEVEAHIPYLRYLLSVDPGDPAVTAMDPLARRRKVFEAVRALTLRGASLRPLVLVFEDVHWLDESTEEYLRATIDSTAGASLMLILTFRVGSTPLFGTRSYQTTLTLQSLADDDAVAMAGKILGTVDFPEAVKTALMEKAEGVPLFIEEVARTLLDLGVLRREDGGFRVVKGLSEVSVPDTIQDIIMARLDRLGDDGKRAVQLASVIGRRFLVRLLDRISGLAERMDGLLGELKALEIIYEQGLLPEPAYIFKHALIQDVAYNSLLKDRRKDLHRQVGRAIEELWADRLADHFEELAHHFVNGEEWAAAFEYLVKSGDRAKDAYANQLALDFYGRALEVASRLSPPLPARRLMDVLQQRSRVWLLLTRYQDAMVESRRMLEIAREAGDRLREGEALADLAFEYWATFSSEFIPDVRRFAEEAWAIAQETGDPRVQARSLTYLACVQQVEGNLVEADRKFEESLRLSQAGGFKDVMTQNLVWLGADAYWRGEARNGIAISRQAERAATEVHDGLFELLSLSFVCLGHVSLGEYVEGRAVIEEGLRKAKERNNPFVQGRLANTLGWFHQELGDFRLAQEHNRESEAFGRRIQNPNVEISAAINLGLDYLSLGQAARAVSHLEESLTRVEKFGFGAHRWRWAIHATTYLAEALLATGEPEQALIQVERALVQARATGSQKYVARCHMVRGQIALGAQQWSQAGGDLREALRIARELGFPALTWQAAHLLAEAEWGRDAREEAAVAARLSAETIERVAASLDDPALRQSFLAWPLVQAAQDVFERLGRG